MTLGTATCRNKDDH